jgi:hypothetical protein
VQLLDTLAGQRPQLGHWVSTQRTQYKLHVKEEKTHMTTFTIQELESLGFDSIGRKKGKPKKSNLDDDTLGVRERAEAPEHVQTTAQTQKDFSGREIRSNQVDVTFIPEESDWNGEGLLGYIPGRTEEI